MPSSAPVPNPTRSLLKKPVLVLFVDPFESTDAFLGQLLSKLADQEVKITIASSHKPATELLKHQNIDWVYLSDSNDPLWKKLIGFVREGPNAILRFSKIIRVFSAERDQKDSFAKKLNLFFRLLPFPGKNWDVIYFPRMSSAIGLEPLMNLGIKTIVRYTENPVNVLRNDQNRRLLEGIQNVLRKTTIVHCETEDLRKGALQHGLDPAKVVVIRPGIDFDFSKFNARESSEEPKRLRVINVAPLTWRNAHQTALLAIKLLVDKNMPVSFDIIGDGQELQHILFTIQDLELQRHVRLLEVGPEQKVLDHFQNADVFLLSNLVDGFSVNVLKAMSCGLPVVATDCGGVREAITPGVEGILVPLRDSVAMADALYKLWIDPSLRMRMSAAAMERIQKEFAVSDQVLQLKELLIAVSENTFSPQAKTAIG